MPSACGWCGGKGAGVPDADLLAAVAEELGFDPDDPRDHDVAALAVRAAGRVLAERLRAEGEAAQREHERDGKVRPWPEPPCPRKAALDAAAERVARWCGAEPDGTSDGAPRATSPDRTLLTEPKEWRDER
jgi:hypothetical protein